MATARTVNLANWYMVIEGMELKGKTVGPGGPDRSTESSVEVVDHLAIVPGGVAGESQEVDRILEEPDRPVRGQGVHPPAVFGGERDRSEERRVGKERSCGVA